MLTKLSVKKPYSVIVAVVIIVLLGIAAFTGIRTDLLPDVDYPYAVIITEYEDASPEEVENTVTQPIEKALASLGKVISVDSVSTTGCSVVTVEFDPSVNMDNIVAEMREAFEPLGSEWGNAVSSPMIRKINPDSMSFETESRVLPGKYVRAAAAALEMENPMEAEKFLNRFRLEMLEEIRPTDGFSEEYLYYYGLRLKLLLRMRQFDTDAGEAVYREIYRSILHKDRLEALS